MVGGSDMGHFQLLLYFAIIKYYCIPQETALLILLLLLLHLIWSSGRCIAFLHRGYLDDNIRHLTYYFDKTTAFLFSSSTTISLMMNSLHSTITTHRDGDYGTHSLVLYIFDTLPIRRSRWWWWWLWRWCELIKLSFRSIFSGTFLSASFSFCHSLALS